MTLQNRYANPDQRSAVNHAAKHTTAYCPRICNTHETVQLHLRVRMPSPFLRVWPELLHPVDFPDESRWEDFVRQFRSRYLQGDDVPYLVPLFRFGVVILGPLSQRPAWNV